MSLHILVLLTGSRVRLPYTRARAVKQLFWYGLYAHRESIPPYVGKRDMEWLRDMPTLASSGRGHGDGSGGGGGSGSSGSDFTICDDLNVNCNTRWRWHTPPGSSPYGAHFPVWAVHPPKYRVFNLYEPFGRGHVVSDLPVELGPTGSNLTGFKGELAGISSHLPYGPLFDMVGIHKPHVWGDGGSPPGGGFCAPHFSQTKPKSEHAPLWGWHQGLVAPSQHAAEGHGAEGHLPVAERQHAKRRWFRAWAVTFSTPYFKERALPGWLLVGTGARGEADCRNRSRGRANPVSTGPHSI